MTTQPIHRPGRPRPALSRRALLAGTAAGAVGIGPSTSRGRADDGALPCRCRPTVVRPRPPTPTPHSCAGFAPHGHQPLTEEDSARKVVAQIAGSYP